MKGKYVQRRQIFNNLIVLFFFGHQKFVFTFWLKLLSVFNFFIETFSIITKNKSIIGHHAWRETIQIRH